MALLVPYSVTVFIFVLSVVCFTLSNVMLMEGTDRQCSVSRLVLYSVTVFISVFLFVCVSYSSVVFM